MTIDPDRIAAPGKLHIFRKGGRWRIRWPDEMWFAAELARIVEALT